MTHLNKGISFAARIISNTESKHMKKPSLSQHGGAFNNTNKPWGDMGRRTPFGSFRILLSLPVWLSRLSPCLSRGRWSPVDELARWLLFVGIWLVLWYGRLVGLFDSKVDPRDGNTVAVTSFYKRWNCDSLYSYGSEFSKFSVKCFLLNSLFYIISMV